ncbi:MAG: SAM-dependent methyltransferase [Verrucomicrobia bacterium]|nr:SAM-dependent methyltransferase [Verrucomicrobiota bacterium]
MQALDSTRSSVLEPPHTRLPADSAAGRKHELGQFLTPESIGAFMASLFEAHPAEIRLLDAGAGDGALIAAFVRQSCGGRRRPKRIAVTAYELDEAIVLALERTLHACERECRQSGIEFSAELRNEDFIEAAVSLVRRDLFGVSSTPFNAAILNPPYRKINSDSHTRRLLREAGIETSNLYTGFLALAAKLLAENGEMVAICPRSFCNGPYFRPFREQFLDMMSLRRLHVFDSRSAAFQHDEVLQENIIVHAVKSPEKPESVIISTSSGEVGGKVTERACPYSEVISPRDPERFIHLVAAESDEAVRQKMRRFATPLAKMGLEISTGRVVDFRAKQFLVREAQNDTAPLIYPCHFNGGFVHWPKPGGRKPNAIRDVEHTQELLVPGAIYVLVKRFTSKEERRRVVACIYDPHRIRAERVGFENHLNYFHARGRGLPMDLAKGLAAFLNSTLVDVYFRQFNGHTQVNATDLRNLHYPTRAELESLGRKIGDAFPGQAELDALVEKELL